MEFAVDDASFGSGNIGGTVEAAASVSDCVSAPISVSTEVLGIFS